VNDVQNGAMTREAEPANGTTASPGADDTNLAECATDVAAESTVESVVESPAESTLANWSRSLAGEFTQLAQSLLNGDTVADVLRGIVAASSALVPDADLVSITMRTASGEYTTPFCTDVLAEQLDQLQYTHNEGPCVEATRTPGPGIVDVTDLRATPRWMRWAPAAAALGIGSVLAIGLAPEGRSSRLGALNFYAFHPHKFKGLDRDMVVLLASHAAVALAATHAVTAAELELAQLRTALATRDVIGQAKGILMQRRGIGSDEAFQVLRRASQHLNVKLADIAALLATKRADLLDP
jgi:hypothetical protein